MKTTLRQFSTRAGAVAVAVTAIALTSAVPASASTDGVACGGAGVAHDLGINGAVAYCTRGRGWIRAKVECLPDYTRYGDWVYSNASVPDSPVSIIYCDYTYNIRWDIGFQLGSD